MTPLIQHKKTTTLFLVTIMLGPFGLFSHVQAVVPAPDGCYPNYTTAEGCNALRFLTTGAGNTGLGWYSLFSNATNSFNTGIGAGALVLNTADNNTATGAGALLLNTTGTNNTANGVDALVFNDTGEGNTATGAFALFQNTTGSNNTAVGASALFWNNDNWNTAIGSLALYDNADGNSNTAVGFQALTFNSGGSLNTAVGYGALSSNTAGGTNVALGASALDINTTGSNNTAIGFEALEQNATGNNNTAIGESALYFATGENNTAIGEQALFFNTTGSFNTAIGYHAGSGISTESGVICIGDVGGAGASGTCYIANIRGVQTQNADAIPVLIDSYGQLGTASSSRRFKTDIKPIDKASESILALRPVSFRYKVHEDGTPQFGLIAEEVAEVNPDLVIYDADGKPYTVRYEAVNAMLLNEFLKEHRKVQELEATVAQLKNDLQATAGREQQQIEALTAGLQKVSAELELSKSAPQTVKNTD